MIADSASLVCLDVGTTNSRAWLVQGDSILGRASAPVGVRDTSRDGSNARLLETLKDLIASVIAQGNGAQPRVVIGAGMIGSSLGVADVPHVLAPAGLPELAVAVKHLHLTDITPLPLLIVPGVRTGSPVDDPIGSRDVTHGDIMRGEETLCLGLIARQIVRAPATVLNLGSHWKAIQIDAAGRVAASVTSLSGEMIHAIQTGTILASAVPPTKPQVLSDNWIAPGMAQQRRSGLTRAMFAVRLLEQAAEGSPQERMAFLIGAFIASDLDALIRSNSIRSNSAVFIVGPTALAHAWKFALADAGIGAIAIDQDRAEQGLLAGLSAVFSRAGSAT